VAQQNFDPFGAGGLFGSGALQFTGHERDQANLGGGVFDLPDYMHARYYDKVGRFLSVDPILSVEAMRSPQLWNRYAYVGNNPLIRTDPTGKVLEFSGTEEDRRKVEGIANGGLNGYQLKISRNGTASLAKTKANGKETSEQKALRESLQKVIGDTATTTIYAESNTNRAVIGQFDNCTIDPADMAQFGTTAQPNAASALGHEVMEQYGKQVMGMADVGFAHPWAMQYENMFTGWVRGGQARPVRVPGGLVYGDNHYTQGDQKMDVRVFVNPETWNVSSILRITP
jgi:RHS repeat-associated protein